MAKSSKLKILVCGVLPPPRYGHSVMYEMLMESSFAEVHDVLFLNMHFWSYKSNKKVTIVKVLKMIKYYFLYLWHLIVKRPQYVLYNISFYPMPFMKDFLFCSTGIILGVKMVLHDHGQYVNELYQSFSDFKKGLLRWMLNNVFASIIMGENTRREYINLMDEKKIFIGEGGIRDIAFKVRQENHEQDKLLNVLYFSHLSFDKGADIAFKAAAAVLQKYPHITFHFAGPIVEEKMIDHLKKLKDDFLGRVIEYGYVEDEEQKRAIFDLADIFIFPTRRDVFGLVLLDAMSFGLPIVASQEGNVPYILPQIQHQMMIEKGDSNDLIQKIDLLINDDLLRRRLGKDNRKQFLNKYTEKKYGERITCIFSQLENNKLV